MTYLTRQQIYDTVKAAMTAQNRKAGGPAATSCMYRTEDGARCAAGCLIRDEFYSPEFEGVSMTGSSSNTGQNHSQSLLKAALQSSGIDPADFDFLRSLQYAHDSADPADFLPEFLARAKTVATHYQLTP